jgi:HNH endonuclease
VRGCSRAAAHVHHVTYRSAGGGDDLANLVSLCAAHHLHGVHMGFIRVSGKAPDELHWELGRRRGEGGSGGRGGPPPAGVA